MGLNKASSGANVFFSVVFIVSANAQNPIIQKISGVHDLFLFLRVKKNFSILIGGNLMRNDYQFGFGKK